MKIHPVGAELFHVDGQIDRQTDMTKLIVSFHSFADAPKMQQQPLKTTLEEAFHKSFQQ